MNVEKGSQLPDDMWRISASLTVPSVRGSPAVNGPSLFRGSTATWVEGRGAGARLTSSIILIFCELLDHPHEIMAPSHTTVTTADGRQGPHPSYIKSAKPFIFDREIRECLTKGGSSANRDNKVRLEGISWIDGVRRALHL